MRNHCIYNSLDRHLAHKVKRIIALLSHQH